MNINEILNDEGVQLANDIRANIGSQWATGETGASIRFEIKQEGTKVRFQLFAREFFWTLITGRRPTPDKKPSRQMIANLRRWVDARGIDLDAVWAIATKIQKEGTKLWQEGGKEDNIVAPALDDFVNTVSMRLADAKADDLILKVREMKW